MTEGQKVALVWLLLPAVVALAYVVWMYGPTIVEWVGSLFGPTDTFPVG